MTSGQTGGQSGRTDNEDGEDGEDGHDDGRGVELELPRPKAPASAVPPSFSSQPHLYAILYDCLLLGCLRTTDSAWWVGSSVTQRCAAGLPTFHP